MPGEKGIIIGLTGSFGSGCSTLMEALKTQGFEGYSLSDIIWDIWRDENPGKKDEEALREQLQDIGNKLRKDEENGVLAIRLLESIKEDGNENKNLVIDSIRNTTEIRVFRENYPDNFYLIGVECPRPLRWPRVNPKQYAPFGLGEEEFIKDDERDRNEEGFEHGQQVQKCVDESDITIKNDDHISDKKLQIKKLSEKMVKHIELLSGILRPPKDPEYFMSLAYTASLKSQCFKR
ncbi:AAA family ATPase [archaeon]|nr:AAA family ATPase [archaeon]